MGTTGRPLICFVAFFAACEDDAAHSSITALHESKFGEVFFIERVFVPNLAIDIKRVGSCFNDCFLLGVQRLKGVTMYVGFAVRGNIKFCLPNVGNRRWQEIARKWKFSECYAAQMGKIICRRLATIFNYKGSFRCFGTVDIRYFGGTNENISSQLPSGGIAHVINLPPTYEYQTTSYKNEQSSKGGDKCISCPYVAHKLAQPLIFLLVGITCTISGYFLQDIGNGSRLLRIFCWTGGLFLVALGPLIFWWGFWVVFLGLGSLLPFGLFAYAV